MVARLRTKERELGNLSLLYSLFWNFLHHYDRLISYNKLLPGGFSAHPSTSGLDFYPFSQKQKKVLDNETNTIFICSLTYFMSS